MEGFGYVPRCCASCWAVLNQVANFGNLRRSSSDSRPRSPSSAEGYRVEGLFFPAFAAIGLSIVVVSTAVVRDVGGLFAVGDSICSIKCRVVFHWTGSSLTFSSNAQPSQTICRTVIFWRVFGVESCETIIADLVFLSKPAPPP